MGFKKTDLVGEVEIKLTYPKLYTNGNGGPVVFVYHFRRQRKIDADKEVGITLKNIDRFCDFLIAEPGGFDDFPKDERKLSDRAREYFGPDDMQDFVNDAMNRYWEVVYPAEFFRGL